MSKLKNIVDEINNLNIDAKVYNVIISLMEEDDNLKLKDIISSLRRITNACELIQETVAIEHKKGETSPPESDENKNV